MRDAAGFVPTRCTSWKKRTPQNKKEARVFALR
jgi:hypothetical protein